MGATATPKVRKAVGYVVPMSLTTGQQKAPSTSDQDEMFAQQEWVGGESENEDEAAGASTTVAIVWCVRRRLRRRDLRRR